MSAILLVLLLGCPKAPSEPAASLGPDTRFTFAWPDGLDGTREAVRTSERRVGEQVAGRSVHTTERWSVSRSEEGWVVHTAEARFLDVDGGEPPPLMNALAAVPLDFSVADDGSYAGVIDAEGWEQRAREAMAEAVPPNDPMAAIQADLAAQAGPLEQALQRDWFGLVELWTGEPAAPGSSGMLPGTDPTGAMSTQVTQWSVSGPVPCGDGGKPRCVTATAVAERPMGELEQESSPVLATWLRALPEAPESSAVEDLHGEVRLELVLEPHTQVPWRMVRSRSMSGVARVDEDTLPFETVDRKVVTWSWSEGRDR